MVKIEIINGPNLNLLGKREPDVYGTESLEDINEMIRRANADLDVELTFSQSNSEGEIIDMIQRARFENNVDAIVINPGAYTHYSISTRDAISAVEIPVVEVHLSNIHAREPFRHVSIIAGVCKGRLEGFGWRGYAAAVRMLAEELRGGK